MIDIRVRADHVAAEVTELPKEGPIPCPVAGCEGQVVEAEVAYRWNRLRVENGHVFASTGDEDWSADKNHWVCDDTGYPVSFASAVTIEDYL